MCARPIPRRHVTARKRAKGQIDLNRAILLGGTSQYTSLKGMLRFMGTGERMRHMSMAGESVDWWEDSIAYTCVV